MSAICIYINIYVCGINDRFIHIMEMNHLLFICISYIFPPCGLSFHLIIAIFDRYVSYNIV